MSRNRKTLRTDTTKMKQKKVTWLHEIFGHAAIIRALHAASQHGRFQRFITTANRSRKKKKSLF